MQINFESDKPIFLQISEQIEDAILSGAIEEEDKIPSITEFSTTYKINPATALKGINILVDSGIVYKRRGIGMFVSTGATEQLKKKRINDFYERYIAEMIKEAKRLDLSESDIKNMIERGFKK